ncbi:MAG: NADH-quinone oxidoreductase subunit L, partial [Candidatus Marinimicrobia bacterium]|nr:NADH-quinone oxidoreductase subunit L [Candidatus Neomarinimicrobiota bacterium]
TLSAHGYVGWDPHPWLTLGGLEIRIGLMLDPLTAIMLAMVTFVSMLVAIYAAGYMRGDRGYWRFFSYIGLFVFSMTMLVSVSNFVLLYVFWEAVGLCSYLLIGFWYEKPAAAAAGKKAFLVNRVGDFGFALGLFLIWTTYGTLNFHDTKGADGTVTSAGVLGQTMLAQPERYHVEYHEADSQDSTRSEKGSKVLLAICLLLMLGACGKSAQFPLHVWLPDAMEGPSPVSALIHAATMVTAGVYMVARCMPLFLASEFALEVVAVVGALTALLAALIALTQTDLKRVLAYSTISQLGFMFLSLGTGSLLGVTAAMFHLFTHAFFKSLLFLGAGSVIHGLGGEQDMRKMGGLKKAMPGTHLTMLVGVLAIAGIPGLSGFFSKDEILWAAFSHYTGFISWIWLIGIITVGLTSFYMFRLLFLTFYGQPNEKGRPEPHESPSIMIIPLILLAFLSILGGYVGIPESLGGHNAFHHFLAPVVAVFTVAEGAIQDTNHLVEILLMAMSTAVALGGAYYAYQVYVGQPAHAEALAQKLQLLHRLSFNKYYVDEAYQALVVRPLRSFSGLLWRWFDEKLVDRVANGAGDIFFKAGGLIRLVQNGLIQQYAAFILVGVLFIMGYIYLN